MAHSQSPMPILDLLPVFLSSDFTVRVGLGADGGGGSARTSTPRA